MSLYTPTRHYLDLIERFEGLKQIAPDRRVAKCPAHDDKSPSLHITDAGDKLLVKCFAGCTFHDIADAIGAAPFEFFERGKFSMREARKERRVPARDALEVIRGEMWVLITAAEALQKGPLSENDHQRLVLAGRRIEQARRATQ